MNTYKIIRYYKKSGKRKILFKNVSLEIAQLHCRDKKTSSKLYFDGYIIE